MTIFSGISVAMARSTDKQREFYHSQASNRTYDGITGIYHLQNHIRVANNLQMTFHSENSYMREHSGISASRKVTGVIIHLHRLIIGHFLSTGNGILLHLSVTLHPCNATFWRRFCSRTRAFCLSLSSFMSWAYSLQRKRQLHTSCRSSSLKGQLLGIPGSRCFWMTFPALAARLACFFSLRFRSKYYPSLSNSNLTSLRAVYC